MTGICAKANPPADGSRHSGADYQNFLLHPSPIPGQQKSPLLRGLSVRTPSFQKSCFCDKGQTGVRNSSKHIPSRFTVLVIVPPCKGAAHPDCRRSSRNPRPCFTPNQEVSASAQPRMVVRCANPHRRSIDLVLLTHVAGRGWALALPFSSRRVENPDHYADRKGREGSGHRPGDGRRLFGEAIR
jgi:hypothetical protein